MKVVITLNSIEELDSLLSLKSRNKVSNGILHFEPSPEEVSTGADGDIDKPKSTIVITKVTEEDNW